MAHIVMNIHPITMTTSPNPPVRFSAPRGRTAAFWFSSLLAMLLGLGVARGQNTPQATAPASAPSQSGAAKPDVVLDEMVITGVRGSLTSAAEVKQNALQFVDSIVAQDIGKLPDNTVADALQRVPGIQVGRDNGEVN